MEIKQIFAAERDSDLKNWQQVHIGLSSQLHKKNSLFMTLRTASYLLDLLEQHTICHELDLCFIRDVPLVADLIGNHSVGKHPGTSTESLSPTEHLSATPQRGPKAF